MSTIYFDLETTGVDPQNDRIISVSFDCDGDKWTYWVNPGRPILEAATRVHGITDAMIANAPPFEKVARQIADDLDDCDTIAGYNCNRFDVPMLAEELYRAGIEYDFSRLNIIDVGELYKIQEPRTLKEAVRFYLGYTHDKAHDGESDAEMTRLVFQAQRMKYPTLPNLSADLALYTRHGKPFCDPAGKLTRNGDGELCFNTHKCKGIPIAEEPGYARWMLSKDFPLATKKMISEELARIESQQSAPWDVTEDVPTMFELTNAKEFGGEA